MMAMVDSVTGMVYWVPAEYQPPIMQPPFAPVVMPYRFLRGPVMAPAAAAAAAPVVNTTVFVRGVPREATTQTVESHFRAYGDIVSCHVIRHKDASTNKGIAFVKFHDHAAAQRAIDCNHPGVIQEREIFAEWAHPKPTTSAAAAAAAEASSEHIPARPPPLHLINCPSFFPAAAPISPVMPAITPHFPWMASSPPMMAPYAAPPIHVLGYPHPDNFSTTYLPVVDTYHPGSSSVDTYQPGSLNVDEDTPSQHGESSSSARQGKARSNES